MKTGFELVPTYQGQEGLLPVKATKYSAGYDFKSAEDITIPVFRPGIKPVLVATGVKVNLKYDQVLLCFNRSSNPIKRGLVLANSVGVVDADYHQEIKGIFWNFSDQPYQIKQGDRIMQGVVINYQNLDKAFVAQHIRQGGFGSTDTYGV